MWNIGRFFLFFGMFIGFSTNVQAHGRFPRTNGIEFDPSDGNHFIVRTTFGGLVSRDGGENYDWFCRSLSKLSTTEDPAMVLVADGGLLTASFAGLSRSASLHCDWGFPSEDLTTVVVIDITRHPTSPDTAFVVTSSGGVANSVFQTTDNGASWEATSPPIDTILFERIRLAPSEPDRIYLSGAIPPTDAEPRRPFVHRSMDGGANWESFPFALQEGDRNIFLEAVDPINPDKLYMLVRSRPDSDTPDRIVMSEDAGETFADIFSAPIITGLVLSDDGEQIWISAQRTGFLLGAEPKDPFAGLWFKDGDAEFEHLRDDLSLSCISRQGETLWVCAENYEDDFALATSDDNGTTFQPKLVFEDIRGQLQCSTTALAETCQQDFEDFDRDVLNPPVASDAGVDAGLDAGLDAASPDIGADVAIPVSGCDCSLSPQSPSSFLSFGMLLVGLTFARRRY